jgi:hypothetical protein
MARGSGSCLNIAYKTGQMCHPLIPAPAMLSMKFRCKNM